jgi:tripartite-type tricarboxylate transporter receptor subunit TctC
MEGRMKHLQRKAMICLFACFCLTGFYLTNLYAAASDYPNRPVTVIVPYPAGGVTDIAARALADAMEKQLKQPVIVMNKVGGATTMGGYALATAKPDGYTLGFFPVAPTIPEAFDYFQDAPYTSKDLRPISGVTAPVFAVAVKVDAPWNSFKDLIEYAKKNPGIKVGMGGKQTLQYMFMATTNRTDKTGFVGIPFTGDPQNIAALLGGHISVSMMDYSPIKSLADAKKIKVLAVINEQRADFLPTVPTVGELGYPVKFVSVLGIVAPKGLPDDLATRLDNLVASICKEPDFQTKIRNTTLQIHNLRSAAYQAHLAGYKENVLEFFKEEGLVKK